MEIMEAIHARRSIRAYQAKPVPKKVLEEIIEACQWAPSPGNLQPWQFAILTGDVLEEFKKRLAEKFETRTPSELGFRGTMEMPELYDKRRASYREENDLYLFPAGTENMEEKILERRKSGSRLFGAPSAIIVYTEKEFIDIPWMVMSLGLIAQNLCLAAVAHGLSTCIMGGPVDWPDMLRELLGVPESKVMFCGIPIGYADPEARVNTMPRRRIPLDEWAHWHGF